MAAIRIANKLAALSVTQQTVHLLPRPFPPIRNGSATCHPVRRSYATEGASAVQAPDYLDQRERKIFDTLKTELQPTRLEVQDVSGGCGSMYALDIVSEQFRGLPVIKQHRLVNKVLGEEMKQWHGVQLKTKAP